MKTKFLLFILIFSIVLGPAFAQTGTPDYSVKGIVKDSVTQKPADFITVSLKNAARQVVKSAITKSDGSFILEKLPAGKYTVTVFSMGYGSKVLPVDLTAAAKQKDLGTILINPSSTQLSAVSITVDRPLVKQEADRLSYDLQADPESKANNVLEMMRKVPLLSVDGEDNILLKGEANYKILINGKPSSMMERSPKDILRSMPASTIERIEVKYRTNHQESFGPNFTQNNDYQNYFRTYNVSLNYRFGKLKEAIKRNKRGINNDDVSGGGGSGGS